MTCPRLRHGAPCLALPLLLACQSNTIDIETMSGSGSADDDPASTSGDPTVTVTVTVTTTATTTAGPGPADESSSADATDGPVLDIGVDPPTSDTLLLAVDTVVSPGLPLQGIVWLERGGASTVDLELQWLSLDQGSTTEPRELIGDVYSYPGIPVADDGSFAWDAGVLFIPGAANPITGSDIVVSITAEVVPSGSPYCGRVGGEVMSPITVPLDGSTHAMTSVASVDELPLEFPVSCPP
jgi:hypothetical protein